MLFSFSLETRNDGRSSTLLNWPTVSEKFAWNIVLLLGAGFAIAKAAKVCVIQIPSVSSSQCVVLVVTVTFQGKFLGPVK